MLSLDVKELRKKLVDVQRNLPLVRQQALEAGLAVGIELMRNRIKNEKKDVNGLPFGLYKRTYNDDEVIGTPIDFYESGTLLDGLKVVSLGATEGEEVAAIEPPRSRIVAVKTLAKQNNYNLMTLSEKEKAIVGIEISKVYAKGIKL